MDEFKWEGLACPPLDDYAFEFDAKTDVLDEQFLEVFDDYKSTSPDDNYRVFEEDVNGKNSRGNNGKGKELRTVMRVTEPTETQREWINSFVAQERKDNNNNNNKRRFRDCQATQPIQRRRLNEDGVVDDKCKVDYDSRMEEAVQKLHESYHRFEDAKQRRKIQVIDFQKPVMGELKCKAKSKGKTTGSTCKNKKKFQPLVY